MRSKPEDICEVGGKLLVESVVSPVGGSVPQNYPPNLISQFFPVLVQFGFLSISVGSKLFCLSRRKDLGPGYRTFLPTDISSLHCQEKRS